jgi:hypothetical protein
VNQGSNNVTILLGNGSGTFISAGGSPSPWSLAPGHRRRSGPERGAEPISPSRTSPRTTSRSCSGTDSEGSARPRDRRSPRVGSRAPSRPRTGTGTARSIAVADFASGGVTVLLGSGTGSFGPAAGSPYGRGRNRQPWRARTSTATGISISPLRTTARTT